MENNITISVNIIAKNEADKIANAINSVANLANEIIVIDTGSEDDTPAICTRLGCEVYFHKWSDNFSDARNIALEYSSCDWILVLDADETVNFSYQDLPHDIMNNRQYGGVNLIIRNYIDEKNDSVQSKHRYTRLFRRDDRIRFQGRIHEQIRESIESFYDIYESDLELLHFGYKHIDKDKLERNATLLEKDLAEETDDWKIYHLAETKFAARDTIAAQQNFESIINSSELSEAQSDMVRTRLGQIYLGNDEYSSAQNILNFVSSDNDTEGLRQYVLAAVHLSIGNVSNALELYNSDAVAQSSLIDPNQLQMAKEGAEKYKSIIGK